MIGPRRGRPARADGPAFDRDEVERLIRHGELVPREGDAPVHVWPGPRELGRRYGVSATAISRFAAKLGLPFRERFGRARSSAQAASAGSATTAEPRRGRPTATVQIDWAAIDRLLVEGEPVRLPDGVVIHDYPSHDEVAARFRVHASSVYRYARSQRCLERRAEHRRAALATAAVQLSATQADDLVRGELTVTGDPDDDYIVVRRIVARQYRQAAEAGEIRARDPVIVRETDRLGREAHERKHGGSTADSLQALLAAARERALAGQQRFEALSSAATGMLIEVTGIERPAAAGEDIEGSE